MSDHHNADPASIQADIDPNDIPDDWTEEEGMAEYAEFLEALDADPVLGPSWLHAQEARGWR
jgi:hypothetical protein